MPLVLDILREAWLLVLESAPFLLAGFVLAGLLHAFVPTGRVVRWLGRPNWWSVLKAAAIGTPLPLCSCAVVPVAVQLRKAGASRGATTAFLISTPESGVDSIAITYALLDPVMTVARPVAALLTAFIAGIAQNLWGTKEPAAGLDAAKSAEAECCTATDSTTTGDRCAGDAAAVAAAPDVGNGPTPVGCCSEAEAAGSAALVARQVAGDGVAAASSARRLLTRCYAGLHYALVEMFEDLAPYLVVGFLVAGVFSVALRTFDPLRLALGSPWALPIMLAAGVPVYVCASAATPMIAVLIRDGLSPGAGLAFLLVGPATNAASLVLLRHVLGGRAVAIYLAAIVICAVAAALGVNALYAGTGWTPQALVRAGACCAQPAWYEFGAAAILLACTAYGLYRHYQARLWRA